MPKTYQPIKKVLFIKFLIYVGYELVRTRGDHFIYSKKGLKRPIVITNLKEVPAFHIRTNPKSLNISYTEFMEIIIRIK